MRVPCLSVCACLSTDGRRTSLYPVYGPCVQICLVATKRFCVGRSSYEKRRPKLEKWSLEGLRPIFLVVVSDIRSARTKSSEPYLRLFDSETEAFKFQLDVAGRSCSWFSLEGPARILHQQLSTSLPRKRGRAS